ncbi:MAG: hypothetical protein J5928_01230 [Firmicutes bacterium]|nr:hypothetical protein [Bacillota bacterium]
MNEYDVKSKGARITLIAGHYGSGKSEISVNYALFIAVKLGEEAGITLFDLDIVNPYFRSRECRDLLEQRSIRVVSSAEDFPDVDLPYMPPELTSLFQDNSRIGVMDIGGDPAGARVLARYGVELNKVMQAGEAEIFCVINANRPMTKKHEAAVSYVKKIRDTAGIPITGLINNTHFFAETEPEDIYRGVELTESVSDELGIPIAFHAVERSLAEKLDKDIGPILPMDIFLKKPWEK